MPKPSWLENSTIENLYIYNAFFATDADKDGIDDDIDSDPSYASQINLVTNQEDYSVSILGSGRVVNWVSPSRFERGKDGLSYTEKESLIFSLYSYFYDEFDSINIALDLDEVPEDLEFAATHLQVSNSVSGIGERIFDNSGSFGSQGMLKGANDYLERDGLASSGIHEIAHNWGNKALKSSLPTPSEVSLGHWGYRNIGGVLGGWLPGSLEDLGGGNYRAKNPVTGEFGKWSPV